MKSGWKLSAALGMLLVFGVSTVQAEDPKDIMKMDVGTWNAEIKMWMPGTDEPMMMKGVETNRMLGDLWLVSDFKGDFGGQAFEGHSLSGYDMKTEKYTGTWVDSMTPFPTKMTGEWDAETKTMTWETEGVNPETGEMQEGKMVAKYGEKDSRTIEMWGPGPDGKMMKMMEMTYTKK